MDSTDKTSIFSYHRSDPIDVPIEKITLGACLRMRHFFKIKSKAPDFKRGKASEYPEHLNLSRYNHTLPSFL